MSRKKDDIQGLTGREQILVRRAAKFEPVEYPLEMDYSCDLLLHVGFQKYIYMIVAVYISVFTKCNTTFFAKIKTLFTHIIQFASDIR